MFTLIYYAVAILLYLSVINIYRKLPGHRYVSGGSIHDILWCLLITSTFVYLILNKYWFFEVTASLTLRDHNIPLSVKLLG